MNSNAHARNPDAVPAGGAGPGVRLPGPKVAARWAWAGLCLGLAALPGMARAEADADQPVAEPQPHEAPVGLRLAPGLTLGGWATVQLEAPLKSSAALAHGDDGERDPRAGPGPHDPQFTRRTRIGLSHLAAILWWDPSPDWKLLAEVDRQDAVQFPAHHGDDDGPASTPYLSLERLYLDYRVSDAFRLRVGKFLTPIGRWNQDHADPLTWTTLRPLLSQSAFPTNATGAMAFGSLALGPQGLDYQVFASGRSDWRSSPRIDPFDHALGLRLVLPIGTDLQIGASTAEFVQHRADQTHYRLDGVDAVWSRQGVEISAEAVARRSRDAEDSGERGGFVQGVLPLVAKWSAVVRWESYKRREDLQATRSTLLGLVYRSGRHWVWKTEWVRPSATATGLPRGLLASLTLLF